MQTGWPWMLKENFDLGIAPSASVAPSAELDVRDLSVGAGAVIEEGVHVEAGVLRLGAGARIGARTQVRAAHVELGYRSSIGCDSVVGAVGGRADLIDIGDLSMIGDNNTVLLPTLVVGDYVALHHHSLTSGYAPCVIGHNTWIGQNCTLNCTGELVIGNNVGIGAYTAVYTHAYNGELLEGCQVWSIEPVEVQDNAWIVGSFNVISPGVTVGARSMILTGSVVSKDVPSAHTVAGVPAKDLTEKLLPFKDLTPDEKLELMRRFVREFAEEVHTRDHTPIAGGYVFGEGASAFRTVVCDTATAADFEAGPHEAPLSIVYAGSFGGGFEDIPGDVVLFEIASKRYTKRLTEAESQLIRFMNGYRARFVPYDRPRVTVSA